ncbi:hypothetical protein AB1Y20_007919 [Prymnesium parvum]|uniref:Uncharacterized protein n=1 Tax=Prymnesium parvum TaxID=97485 RepID=A0AB34IV86_PRYPA
MTRPASPHLPPPPTLRPATRRAAAPSALGRRALLHAAALATALPPAPSHAIAALPPSALPPTPWLPLSHFPAGAPPFPEPFTLYLARFLLRYDHASAAWYDSLQSSLPRWWPAATATQTLSRQVAAFATSLTYQLVPYAADGADAAALWRRLGAAYGADGDARAQLRLLFCLLPPHRQPVAMLRAAVEPPHAGAAAAAAALAYGAPAGAEGWWGVPPAAEAAAISAAEAEAALRASPRALLPASTLPVWDGGAGAFRLPGELGEPRVLARGLGRLGRAPITKEVPLAAAAYAGFMASGGCGCALTHLAVVPLDVVKTRIQTRPGVYRGFADALASIREEEGVAMLFQGAGATGVGYFTYGVCVYPLYELFKRALFSAAGAEMVLGARVPLVLSAGAAATVLTCFAITPFEAVRIRMVECPSFAPTLPQAIERYVAEGGVLSLYDGLAPLLVRQVLFGMVKFLIFDTCAEAIKAALPAGAAESAAVGLAVSLVSGALAGVCASIVSQPADVVLSRVAQGDGSSETVGRLPGRVSQAALLRQAANDILRKQGVAGLFRGLPSRCLWSSAIIAGQFFLYDVFKAALHLSAQDLTLFYDALGASAAFASLGSAVDGL